MIEFFFDCSSPWTFLAFKNLRPMAAELGVDIVWKPVLVGGIFNTVNSAVYAAREDMSSAKNRYILKDVQDNARQAGLKIVFPPKIFPVSSVKAMRGCLWIAQDAAAKPHYLDFVEAVFSAYFSREEDISSEAVLADICRACGIDPSAFLAGINQSDIKAALKANTDEAIARGAFGAPTLFVGDDMYFGNDRLTLVRAAVLNAQAALQTPA